MIILEHEKNDFRFHREISSEFLDVLRKNDIQKSDIWP